MSAKTRGGEKHGQRKCSFNSSNVNGPGTLPAFHSRSASPIIRSKYLVGLYGTEKEISLSLANWRRKALLKTSARWPMCQSHQYRKSELFLFLRNPYSYLFLFHSPREIPACRRISETSAAEMFPACGFGTRTLSSPLHIKRCRPPEYGPSNPSSRSRRMRCRSEVLLGMGKCSEPVGIQAKSGNAFTIANFKHKPVLQDLFKFSPASFKRFGISPDAVQFLYLPEISFVAEDFVRSVLKL